MVLLEDILANNVHLGHSVNKWNPKMQRYIFGFRNGIHIIDVLQTILCIEKAKRFLLDCIDKKKTLDKILTFININ